MDSGSEDGGSRQSILKKHKHKVKTLQTCIVVHQQPFMLRFAPQHLIGRSRVSPVHPLGLESTISSKFYSKQYGEPVNNKDIEEAQDKLARMFREGPREKYKRPQIDSHNYGWHHHARFDSTSRSDRRFHHHIRDSHMVKTQMLILATDNKTGRRTK